MRNDTCYGFLAGEWVEADSIWIMTIDSGIENRPLTGLVFVTDMGGGGRSPKAIVVNVWKEVCVNKQGMRLIVLLNLGAHLRGVSMTVQRQCH